MDQKRKKLDAKAKRGVFIGYTNQSKGYRVLILENENIEISRDIEFKENKKWDWKRQKEVKKKTLKLSMEDSSFPKEQTEGTFQPCFHSNQ